VRSDKLKFRRSVPIRGVSGDAAFGAMQTAFQAALDAGSDEVSTTDYTLAGATVRMRIVGERLAESIGSAFRHLAMADTPERPQLVVDLWDEHTTGVACPRAIEEIAEDMTGWREAGFALTVGTPEDRRVGHLLPDVRVWMDREAAHVVGCVADAGRLSVLYRGMPLHFQLLLWHADRGIPVVHAALVSRGDRGVLFVGKGGTGKTTSALACLSSGFRFLADDYVGIEQLESCQFAGHSLYESVWITTDNATRFTHFSPHAEQPGFPAVADRQLIQLYDVAPGRLDQTARIRAVVATELSSEKGSTIGLVPKGKALFALAPSSMLQLPVSGRAILERMAELVQHTPSYRLSVGRDVAALPSLVDELLEQGGTW
jgi:hypothetical protein